MRRKLFSISTGKGLPTRLARRLAEGGTARLTKQAMQGGRIAEASPANAGVLLNTRHGRRTCVHELLLTLTLVFLSCGVSLCQTGQKLSAKKKQLNRIRGNIQLYERRIAESNKRESITLGLVDRLERQNLQARQSINRISDQIKFNSRGISDVEAKIGTTKDKISYLTGQYVSFARSFYEDGREHDLELILTSQSLNEMIIRYEYLEKFSEQTRTDLESIGLEKSRLTTLREKLQRQLDDHKSHGVPSR